jgi:hypothetical protein
MSRSRNLIARPAWLLCEDVVAGRALPLPPPVSGPPSRSRKLADLADLQEASARYARMLEAADIPDIGPTGTVLGFA